MGLLYMSLKNYELAQRNFRDAIDQSPFEADMYYYYSLSLIGGRTFKDVDSKDVKRIEEYLNAAMGMETKCKYLMLLMAVKQEYYLANGLKIQGETPDKLYERALEYAPDGLEEITEYTALRDGETISKIKRAQGLEEEDGGGGKNAPGKEPSLNKKRIDYRTAICPECGHKGLRYNNSLLLLECPDCEFEIDESDYEPVQDGFAFAYAYEKDLYFREDEKSDVKALLDRGQREQLFKFYNEPSYPEKISKPGYSIFERIWKLALNVVLTFIIFIIFALTGVLFTDYKPFPDKTVQQELNEYADRTAKTKKLNRQERAAKYAELKQDSIASAQEKADFFANAIIIGYDDSNSDFHWGKPSENEAVITLYEGIKKEWTSLLWGTLLFLPIIIWLIVTIVKMSSISAERKRIGLTNKENLDYYKFALDMFEKRPTIKGYRSYIYHFLSDANTWVPYGDPVGTELKRNGIDEADLRGKSLFLNYYDENDSGMSLLDAVYYVVAVLEKDCVKVFKNRWETEDEQLGESDEKTAYYSKIPSASIEDGCLNIGDIQIVLPENSCNIFAYQNTDKGDKISYSQDRTSDPKEFLKALNKLITSH
ncbi:MAG: hypothetical protein LBS07_04130 [Prevotellaceae bacterium]|jgi:hypothetical protein|nr:hypothetical protein [Prevotellaceae bacterium]